MFWYRWRGGGGVDLGCGVDGGYLSEMAAGEGVGDAGWQQGFKWGIRWLTGGGGAVSWIQSVVGKTRVEWIGGHW